MSALRHGFFRRGFMLCDRCVLNGKCEMLVPGGECAVERKEYDSVVSELMAQYALDGLVDEILADRAAMYLIRVAGAEAYEANVGVSSASVSWGKYVAGLDRMLRDFLREMALTRASKKSLQKNDVLTDVDDLLTVVTRKSCVKPRIFRRYSPSRSLVRDWRIEKRRLSVGCGEVSLVRRAIPKKAVKALVEHCNRFGEKSGRSGAEVFGGYLKWMKKHADYFFSSPWSPRLVTKKGTWLTESEYEFIGGSGSYDEEIERFTIVLLQRNLSLEGFNAEYFESEFDFYGRWACSYCGVPEAVRLREYTKKLEETMLEIQEKMSSGLTDDFWAKFYEYRKSPESTRSNKIAQVKLEFLETDGGAEGKTCNIWNKYLCPYGEKAWELVDLGDDVGFLWRLVEFYDEHWNVSHTCTHPPSDAKWFHWGEDSILDVTNREDILRALEDGRMNKIYLEYAEYTKEKNRG